MERKFKEKNESEDISKKPKNENKIKIKKNSPLENRRGAKNPKSGPKKGIHMPNRVKRRIKTPAMIANPGGRPSDFDEAAPKIISYIRQGNTYECSAACARISYNTFNRWMKNGLEDTENGILDSKFSKFWYDVRKAEMEAEQECVQAWRNFIPVSWQASRDFLARRNPKDWAQNDRMDITSNGETIAKPFFLPLKDNDEDEE